MPSVVHQARSELNNEGSYVWRRPSRGPGSRSQSADPRSTRLNPLAPSVPNPPNSAGRVRPPKERPSKPSRPRGRSTEVASATAAAGPGSAAPGNADSGGNVRKLLRHRSRSLESEASSLQGSEPYSEGGAELLGEQAETELFQIRTQLAEKRRVLQETEARQQCLSEKLSATQRDAWHFGNTVAQIEAGLREAAAEEVAGAPHLEPRQPAESNSSSEPPLDMLMGNWSNVRRAMGLADD